MTIPVKNITKKLSHGIYRCEGKTTPTRHQYERTTESQTGIEKVLNGSERVLVAGADGSFGGAQRATGGARSKGRRSEPWAIGRRGSNGERLHEESDPSSRREQGPGVADLILRARPSDAEGSISPLPLARTSCPPVCSFFLFSLLFFSPLSLLLLYRDASSRAAAALGFEYLECLHC